MSKAPTGKVSTPMKKASNDPGLKGTGAKHSKMTATKDYPGTVTANSKHFRDQTY